jgi:hypothetical protein
MAEEFIDSYLGFNSVIFPRRHHPLIIFFSLSEMADDDRYDEDYAKAARIARLKEEIRATETRAKLAKEGKVAADPKATETRVRLEMQLEDARARTTKKEQAERDRYEY